MEKINKYFLEALKASLMKDAVSWNKDDISPEELTELFRLAGQHHVSPMIYEAIYESEAVGQLPAPELMGQRRQVIQLVAIQAMKTSELQMLSDHLRKQGIRPCVVKGVVCRDLYPNPDARLSGDEDIFISEEEYPLVHKTLTEYGMTLVNIEEDINKVYEVPYAKSGSPLYIEVHKHLFSPNSEEYGNLNRFFDGIHDRADGLSEVEIDGIKLLTMNPTDHLLYLILHSFKHFLHSGFGIRQVCDINLFAQHYGKVINWDYILKSLREIRADLFAITLFKIGQKYLVFDPEKACYPVSWSSIDVDETDMLEDLLDSGVYGQSDRIRAHSSNITLNAIVAEKRGEKAENGQYKNLFRLLFPPAHRLSERYTYLKKMPFLLPVAWIQRILRSRKELARTDSGNNAVESIKIGNERVNLMRKYGIIK